MIQTSTTSRDARCPFAPRNGAETRRRFSTRPAAEPDRRAEDGILTSSAPQHRTGPRVSNRRWAARQAEPPRRRPIPCRRSMKYGKGQSTTSTIFGTRPMGPENRRQSCRKAARLPDRAETCATANPVAAGHESSSLQAHDREAALKHEHLRHLHGKPIEGGRGARCHITIRCGARTQTRTILFQTPTVSGNGPNSCTSSGGMPPQTAPAVIRAARALLNSTAVYVRGIFARPHQPGMGSRQPHTGPAPCRQRPRRGGWKKKKKKPGLPGMELPNPISQSPPSLACGLVGLIEKTRSPPPLRGETPNKLPSAMPRGWPMRWGLSRRPPRRFRQTLARSFCRVYLRR